MMIIFRIVSLISVTLLTFSLTVWCLEIQVYECPCMDANCNAHFENGNLSTIWRTFTYPVEQDENITEHGTIRLVRSKNDVLNRPDDMSENIIINFLEPENAYGYKGELIGTLKATNETVFIEISKTGVLSLFDSNTPHHLLAQVNPESYCVRRLNASHAAVEVYCGRYHKSCIRKCCPSGYVFSNDIDVPCVPTTSGENKEWMLPVMLPGSSSSVTGKNSIKIRTGFPDCHNMYNVSLTLSSALTKFSSPLPRIPFRIYEDGVIQYLGGGPSGLQWKNKVVEADYCVDTLSVPEDKLDLTCGVDEQDVLMVCIKDPFKSVSTSEWEWQISRLIKMAAMLLSIFFLLITAMVHFLLWEKQNIHAWTILGYVVSLTGFYVCLLAIYAEETRKRRNLENFISFFSERGCYALGVITHFMGIFTFSWLSVINFDLWWTFRILKPMNQRNFEFKRLFCYASFASVVPTAVVSVGVALQLTRKKGSESCREFEEDRTVYPMYGQESCFLKNSSQPYYFYLPVGVLLLANLIFYLCTSCQMLRIYNATKRLSDKNTKKQKESCELFCKLFLVMGTTWIFQVILSLVENEDAVSTWYFVLYVVLDLTNIFQAIAIFVIFVCKRETLRALQQKYTCLKSCLHPFRGMYRTPTIISRSDGSTKMSRTEFTKHNSIDSCSSGGAPSNNDHRRDSELIIFS